MTSGVRRLHDAETQQVLPQNLSEAICSEERLALCEGDGHYSERFISYSLKHSSIGTDAQVETPLS